MLEIHGDMFRITNMQTVYYDQNYYEPGYRTCPYCGSSDTHRLDAGKEGDRRECDSCMGVWERVQRAISTEEIAAEAERLTWNTHRE